MRSGFVAFNTLAHVSPSPRAQRALMRVTTPAKARLDAAEGKAVFLSGRLRRLCGDLIEGG